MADHEPIAKVDLVECAEAFAAVVAQAGTGKSRFCFEFVESCRAAGLTATARRATTLRDVRGR